MDLLLAERLLLISLDPRSGRPSSDPSLALAPALSGALLMDLLFRDAARLEGGLLAPLRPPGDPLLDETLGRIAARRRPRKLKYWVSRLGDPRKQLLARLVEGGVLAARPHRILGLFPTTRHEVVQHAALDDAVASLRAPLLGRPWDPTPEVTALVALVSVTGLVKSVVPGPHVRDAQRRAKAIAKGNLGGRAVSEVVDEAQAAVMAAVIASTTAAAAASR